MTPEFEKFMNLIGKKVLLDEFDGFYGGLKPLNNGGNQYSYYKKYRKHEIMFHVSPLLPHDPIDPQNVFDIIIFNFIRFLLKNILEMTKLLLFFRMEIVNHLMFLNLNLNFSMFFLLLDQVIHIHMILRFYTSIYRNRNILLNTKYFSVCCCISKDVPLNGIFLPNFPFTTQKKSIDFLLQMSKLKVIIIKL